MTLAPHRDALPHLPAPALGADVPWVREWALHGRCAGQDPDALFVEGKEQRQAKTVCQKCPVIAECLADALDNRTPFGVWGGMTERERRALLRARPDVESWTRLLKGMRVGGHAPAGAVAAAVEDTSTRR